jgi:tetratricopeptide (TPR) repeat protein
LEGSVPALRLRLGEELVFQGQLDEAEEQLQRLLGDNAYAAPAQLGLARVAYQRGQWDQARSFLTRCQGSPLTRKAAANLLAEIDQRANDPKAAAQDRARAADLSDDLPWADPFVEEVDRIRVGKSNRLAAAVRLARTEHLAEAETQFRALAGQYPDWDQVWLDFGRFHLDHRNYPAAETALKKAVALAPDSVPGHFYLGVVLFQRQSYTEAASHFRDTLRLKPDHALAAFNLGHCLLQQNDRAGAIEAFRLTVRNKPQLAAAHIKLGELLAEKGDNPEAIKELRLGLELKPDDATARKLLEQLRPEK